MTRGWQDLHVTTLLCNVILPAGESMGLDATKYDPIHNTIPFHCYNGFVLQMQRQCDLTIPDSSTSI